MRTPSALIALLALPLLLAPGCTPATEPAPPPTFPVVAPSTCHCQPPTFAASASEASATPGSPGSPATRTLHPRPSRACLCASQVKYDPATGSVTVPVAPPVTPPAIDPPSAP